LYFEFKKEIKHEQNDDIEDHFEVSSSQFSDLNLNEKDLLNLLNELPNQYKVVFNLYAIEGFSHKEIAEIMNTTEGTSRSSLTRARTMLKKLIQKEYILD
jgi:RNA polymerase sigma-70 factor (ECF subfamily)